MPANPLASDLEHILAHTVGLWDELRGQRIFITGGTGFFGCWLLESFIWANTNLKLDAHAVVLTRDPAAFANKAPHLAQALAITLHRGDIRNFQFPTGSFSHVIHAATTASTKLNAKKPLEMLDTIIGGTRHTLDFAVACQAKKFLLTSSGAVYGRQPTDLTHIPEEYLCSPDALNPLSTYGESKRLAELLCAIYHQQHGLEIKISRCFAFIGPYLPLNAHFAIGNFLRDSLVGGPIQIKGDGTPYRSYLYAADLAIWLWTILARGQSCRAYNVGSDEAINIATLAECVRQTVSDKTQITLSNQPVAGQPVQRYVPSVDRSRHELQLDIWISLPQAIQKTIDYCKAEIPHVF